RPPPLFSPVPLPTALPIARPMPPQRRGVSRQPASAWCWCSTRQGSLGGSRLHFARLRSSRAPHQCCKDLTPSSLILQCVLLCQRSEEHTSELQSLTHLVCR